MVGYVLGAVFFVLFFALFFRKVASLFIWFNLALLLVSLVGGAQFFAGLGLGVLGNRIFALLPSSRARGTTGSN